MNTINPTTLTEKVAARLAWAWATIEDPTPIHPKQKRTNIPQIRAEAELRGNCSMLAAVFGWSSDAYLLALQTARVATRARLGEFPPYNPINDEARRTWINTLGDHLVVELDSLLLEGLTS